MEAQKKLDKELLNGALMSSVSASLKSYVDEHVSLTQCMAVMSDMKLNQSTIWYGDFGRYLGFDGRDGDTFPSIWEKKIYDRIVPEDLAAKHLRELKYLDFIRHKKPSARHSFCLVNQIKMTVSANKTALVKHTMRYIHNQQDEIIAALCTYEPLVGTLPSPAIAIDNCSGEYYDMNDGNRSILSSREAEVLRLIGQGLGSFEIASTLNISKNTVSRHRQNIISRLQVKNTTEAFRLAQALKLT